MQSHDIIIAGGGPAGLSFARSLAGSGMKVLLVEKSPGDLAANPDPDGRDIALTHLSRKILTNLGVWQRFDDVAPLKAAKVINGNSSYTLDFDNRGELEALGFLVANHHIRRALFDELTASSDKNIELLFDTEVKGINFRPGIVEATLSAKENKENVAAKLLVGADSRFSQIRGFAGIAARMQNFSRTAIVCRMEHEKPNRAIAVECFLYGGRTMAILPLNGKASSIVITVANDKAQAIMESSEDEFNRDTARRLKYRLGNLKLVGKRHAYSLVGVFAENFVKPRIALIGDAAVGMHPVTAHGFNLGLRGQDTLARTVTTAFNDGRDIGLPSVLETYENRHMLISKPLYLGTNGIVRMFTDESYPAKLMRDMILRAANNISPLKRFITHSLTETESWFS